MPSDNESGKEWGRPLRTLTEARHLRALSHPVRLALMEVLAVSGPLTATQAGELIGESPTTCSFHLRQLARYGFVEEAGGGKGRSRPWKLAHLGFSVPAQPENSEFTRAQLALDDVMLERYLQRIRRFLHSGPSYPPEWQRAATADENIWYLTAEEMAEVVEEYRRVTRRLDRRFVGRTGDAGQRPENSRPVETLFFAYPVELPGGER